MGLREILETQLTKDEGLRYTVYDDANGNRVVPGYTLIGHPTIGIGRCLDLNGISNAEAYFLLHNDIDEAIINCKKYNWFNTLSEIRQSVIVNMMFQLGAAKFAAFKKFISACEVSNWKSAHNEGLDSLWAKQSPDRVTRLMTILVYDTLIK